ncbi:hypothetical protein EVAR_54524_1 [Eumeta japonica]|uniref:Uncharacterized protein n=1 Tax=Eumeta variegata TaxID=151549 RepID=A0A4C1YGD1_EUMVA|nr:hypothetical protein EVAR_54524_1 [Eumeta japonica]
MRPPVFRMRVERLLNPIYIFPDTRSADEAVDISRTKKAECREERERSDLIRLMQIDSDPQSLNSKSDDNFRVPKFQLERSQPELRPSIELWVVGSTFLMAHLTSGLGMAPRPGARWNVRCASGTVLRSLGPHDGASRPTCDTTPPGTVRWSTLKQFM